MKIDENGTRRKLSKRKDPELSLDFYRQDGYHPGGVKVYLMTLLNSNYEEWRAKNPDASYRDFPFSIKKMSVSGCLFDFDKLNDVSEARWTRFSEMVEKLQKLGYDIREKDVLAVAGASKSISRSHIGRVLVSKGYFKTVRDAFSELLQKGRPAYVPHYRLEVAEIISLIHQAGGMAVLAHPKLIWNDEIVEDICRSGIDGIEAFYPQHNPEDTAHYLALAEKYQLLPSGGSDFHGFPTRYPTELGIFTIEDRYAEPFYQPET